MAELVREEIPLEAFDVPEERLLRVFFLVPEAFVAEVALKEGGAGDPIGVAAYRRVFRATEPGEPEEVDGAFLVVGRLALELREPWAGRSVVHLGSATPVATLEAAARRDPDGDSLLRAAASPAVRWRFPSGVPGESRRTRR